MPAQFRAMSYTLGNRPGGAQWSHLITTQNVAQNYAEVTQSFQRFNDGGSSNRDVVGDLAYTCMGKPIIYDPFLKTPLAAETTTVGWGGTIDSANTSRAYFISASDFHFIQHPLANTEGALEPDWRTVDGGFDQYKLLLVRCQLLSPARNRHGLVFNIALTDSST